MATVQFGDGRLPDRFWDKVTPCPMSGCWIWTAYVNDDGYGRYRHEGAPRRAHRVAFEALVGQVPDGLEPDHRCRVRCCVNPAHLEPVTRQVNVLRGESPAAAHAVADACPAGHVYDAANTRITRVGKRVCRTCHRLRVAANKSRWSSAKAKATA